MKKAIKKRWIKALRSGEFSQTTGELKSRSGGYCCLGVLCELHRRSKAGQGNQWEGKLFDFYLDESAVLSREVMQWAGLEDDDPRLGRYTATAHNDGCDGAKAKSFKQIANLIEKHL